VVGDLVAAIDQGSSSTKGAVFDDEGGVRAEAAVEVASRADGDRVEHDAFDLAAGVESVLAELRRAGPLAALGIACQRSTCLLWDRRSGRPVTPALSWQDRRAAAAARHLAPRLAEEVARRTGLRLSPHYAALKLRELFDAEPALHARATDGKVVAGTLDAFLVHRLTGSPSTEPGAAGRTLLYDLEADRWSPELCAAFGIPEASLPPLAPSASQRGAAAGLPLLALAGDQQAALLGHGGWRPGTTAVHFGTGAFVLASTGASPRRHPGLLTAVLASSPSARRFQLEGSVSSAGSAVDWACAVTGVELETIAGAELDPERLPWVLPAFAGLAAPWWRPEARPVLAGMTPGTRREELVLGVVAGVAQRVIDNLEALTAAGVAIEVVRVSGRLARLSGLVGLLADAGQVPVERSAVEETGLRGIAGLARLTATGQESALLAPPPVGARRLPRWPQARARRLRERWREFVEHAAQVDPWTPLLA
jgi:glycerol kinase